MGSFTLRIRHKELHFKLKRGGCDISLAYGYLFVTVLSAVLFSSRTVRKRRLTNVNFNNERSD